MPPHPKNWTIGVEEEYQIVHPYTRELASASPHILSLLQPPHSVNTEFQRCQIEIATPVCHTLADVRAEITHARRTLLLAAQQANYWIAAAGTHPFSHWREQLLTESKRYEIMAQRYQQLAREQIILGCHVHISCADKAIALQIVNRARNWLAPLLALSANSPFWLGDDTGYASYRTEIWWRWPMAGPPPFLSSLDDYQQLLNTLVQTECIADTSHLYWDIRISERYPTIEFRIMDVSMTIDEAVMMAGLIRALVQTCYQQTIHDEPLFHAPFELLRSAHWRAARYGLTGNLIDVSTNEIVPAPTLIERFLDLVRPALESNGDWSEIASHVSTSLQHGNGAMRQRNLFQQTGNVRDIVDFVVQETAKGTDVQLIEPAQANHLHRL